MTKIVVTSRPTIIGMEYTATYGPMSVVSLAGREYAIDKLVLHMEFICKHWIIGKSVEVVDVLEKK